MTLSSRPTVETEYPRAQKCCPIGRNRQHHVNVVGQHMLFLDPALRGNFGMKTTWYLHSHFE